MPDTFRQKQRKRIFLEPRREGFRDPEELRRVLRKIYPEKVADELYTSLTSKPEPKELIIDEN